MLHCIPLPIRPDGRSWTAASSRSVVDTRLLAVHSGFRLALSSTAVPGKKMTRKLKAHTCTATILGIARENAK